MLKITYFIFLVSFDSQLFTPAHTRTHTHTHTLSLSLSFSKGLGEAGTHIHTHTHTHTLSLSLSFKRVGGSWHTHTHTHTLSLSLSLSLSKGLEGAGMKEDKLLHHTDISDKNHSINFSLKISFYRRGKNQLFLFLRQLLTRMVFCSEED